MFPLGELIPSSYRLVIPSKGKAAKEREVFPFRSEPDKSIIHWEFFLFGVSSDCPICFCVIATRVNLWMSNLPPVSDTLVSNTAMFNREHMHSLQH